MKRNAWILSCLLLFAATTVSAQAPQTLDGGYRLAWNDEFNLNGRPDPNKWVFEEGFVRNHEWQWYQADNATVLDGSLIITARRERKPNPWYVAGSKDWRKKRPQIECTSACLESKGKYEFRYGRVLVRARIPASRGSWPAIWLLGSKQQYDWPYCGEIDMMEFYEKYGTRSILANACWGSKNNSNVWDDVYVPFTHFNKKIIG